MQLKRQIDWNKNFKKKVICCFWRKNSHWSLLNLDLLSVCLTKLKSFLCYLHKNDFNYSSCLGKITITQKGKKWKNSIEVNCVGNKSFEIASKFTVTIIEYVTKTNLAKHKRPQSTYIRTNNFGWFSLFIFTSFVDCDTKCWKETFFDWKIYFHFSLL